MSMDFEFRGQKISSRVLADILTKIFSDTKYVDLNNELLQQLITMATSQEEYGLKMGYVKASAWAFELKNYFLNPQNRENFLKEYYEDSDATSTVAETPIITPKDTPPLSEDDDEIPPPPDEPPPTDDDDEIPPPPPDEPPTDHDKPPPPLPSGPLAAMHYYTPSSVQEKKSPSWEEVVSQSFLSLKAILRTKKEKEDFQRALKSAKDNSHTYITFCKIGYNAYQPLHEALTSDPTMGLHSTQLKVRTALDRYDSLPTKTKDKKVKESLEGLIDFLSYKLPQLSTAHYVNDEKLFEETLVSIQRFWSGKPIDADSIINPKFTAATDKDKQAVRNVVKAIKILAEPENTPGLEAVVTYLKHRTTFVATDYTAPRPSP